MRVSRQHVSAKSTVNEAQHLDNPVVLHPKRSDMPDVRSQDAIRNAVGVGLRSGGRGPWGWSGGGLELPTPDTEARKGTIASVPSCPRRHAGVETVHDGSSQVQI